MLICEHFLHRIATGLVDRSSRGWNVQKLRMTFCLWGRLQPEQVRLCYACSCFCAKLKLSFYLSWLLALQTSQRHYQNQFTRWSLFYEQISGLRVLFLLNILQLRSHSETFFSFALRLLCKLQIECCNLFKKCSKNDSGSAPTSEIHHDSCQSPLLHAGSCTPLALM